MIKEWLPLFRLRPHYLIAIACAMALSKTPGIYSFAILVAFAYAVSIHGELANFTYDYESDKRNPRMKDYAHITGKIKISGVKIMSGLFLLLSLAAGVALLNLKLLALPLVIFAVHCAYSYSTPPLRLKRYWWGGIVSYTTYTAVVLLVSATIFGAPLPAAGMAALAFWLGSLSVWTLTSIPDQECDRQEGIETQALKFGAANCMRAYLPLALLSAMVAAAAAVKLAGNPYAGLPFLLPAAIGITAYSRMGKEAVTGLTKRTFDIAILPYRYNMALVTLSYFAIQSS